MRIKDTVVCSFSLTGNRGLYTTGTDHSPARGGGRVQYRPHCALCPRGLLYEASERKESQHTEM